MLRVLTTIKKKQNYYFFKRADVGTPVSRGRELCSQEQSLLTMAEQ